MALSETLTRSLASGCPLCGNWTNHQDPTPTPNIKSCPKFSGFEIAILNYHDKNFYVFSVPKADAGSGTGTATLGDVRRFTQRILGAPCNSVNGWKQQQQQPAAEGHNPPPPPAAVAAAPSAAQRTAAAAAATVDFFTASGGLVTAADTDALSDIGIPVGSYLEVRRVGEEASDSSSACARCASVGPTVAQEERDLHAAAGRLTPDWDQQQPPAASQQAHGSALDASGVAYASGGSSFFEGPSPQILANLDRDMRKGAAHQRQDGGASSPSRRWADFSMGSTATGAGGGGGADSSSSGAIWAAPAPLSAVLPENMVAAGPSERRRVPPPNHHGNITTTTHSSQHPATAANALSRAEALRQAKKELIVAHDDSVTTTAGSDGVASPLQEPPSGNSNGGNDPAMKAIVDETLQDSSHATPPAPITTHSDRSESDDKSGPRTQPKPPSSSSCDRGQRHADKRAVAPAPEHVLPRERPSDDTKRDRTLHIRFLPPNMTNVDIGKFLALGGPCLSVRVVVNRGRAKIAKHEFRVCFAEFASKRSAKRLIALSKADRDMQDPVTGYWYEAKVAVAETPIASMCLGDAVFPGEVLPAGRYPCEYEHNDGTKVATVVHPCTFGQKSPAMPAAALAEKKARDAAAVREAVAKQQMQQQQSSPADPTTTPVVADATAAASGGRAEAEGDGWVSAASPGKKSANATPTVTAKKGDPQQQQLQQHGQGGGAESRRTGTTTQKQQPTGTVTAGIIDRCEEPNRSGWYGGYSPASACPSGSSNNGGVFVHEADPSLHTLPSPLGAAALSNHPVSYVPIGDRGAPPPTSFGAHNLSGYTTDGASSSFDDPLCNGRQRMLDELKDDEEFLQLQKKCDAMRKDPSINGQARFNATDAVAECAVRRMLKWGGGGWCSTKSLAVTRAIRAASAMASYYLHHALEESHKVKAGDPTAKPKLCAPQRLQAMLSAFLQSQARLVAIYVTQRAVTDVVQEAFASHPTCPTEEGVLRDEVPLCAAHLDHWLTITLMTSQLDPQFARKTLLERIFTRVSKDLHSRPNDVERDFDPSSVQHEIAQTYRSKLPLLNAYVPGVADFAMSYLHGATRLNHFDQKAGKK